ncbi:response regulator [Cohnella xylanilytica]|uniref:Response regulator n=1 Tax=Cohnella xylanilytica TaxID=557555 RepID=A0A841U819_9BACL|nr:response regulator [Cohnella xylanilytica]MBB6694110.1 response regulator [Cohnella xylanilytica]
MKRKLMIVDDETNIRVGLRAMIERQFPDRYDILLAANGAEALGVLSGGDVELLITDIRMPVMDGIELLERLRELPRTPAVVILSGYDDFQYAKAAIHYQAKEYLLKPIVRTELFAVLERLEDELRLNGERDIRAAAAEPEASERLAQVLQRENVDEKEVRGLLLEAGLDWLDGEYTVGLLKAPAKAADILAASLERGTASGEADWVSCVVREGETVVVARDPNLFPGLLARLRSYSLGQPYLAHSSRARGMGQLRLAYSQARQASKYFLLMHPESGMIGYDAVRGLDSGCPVPEETIRKISNLIGLGRLPEMKRLLQQALDIRVVSRCEIGYLMAVSRLLNEVVFDRVFRTYGEESVEILKLYKKAGHVENFDRFHDYYHHVEQLLERLDEYVAGVRSAHAERADMQKAVDYLHEHYHEDVNMAVVSNYMSLNYTYFSEAFKEFTGESFSAYLRKLRLGKAKELLAKTDLKVYEISARSGFESAKHFTRMFKESEGITPLEYRSRESAARARS